MSKPVIVATVLVFGLGYWIMAAEQKSAPEKTESAVNSHKVLRHVVLFKFKTGTTPAQVKAIEDAFTALPKKIDVIVDFEWGTDVSIENKAEGFTHCFFVTFGNEKGRETYLPHPAHQEFVKLVGPSVDKVLVFDFWSSK